MTMVDYYYLNDLSLEHNLLFVHWHIRQVEYLCSQNFDTQCRVQLEVIESLLIPLDAYYIAYWLIGHISVKLLK